MKNILFLFMLLMTTAIGKAETWAPVGQVEWTEGALTAYSTNYNKTWSVNVERSDDRPQVYRLQPYSSHPLNSSFDNVYVYLHTENPDAVYIEYYRYYFSQGWGHFYHVFQRCPENGFDSRYYGKISEANTIEFPVGAFAVCANDYSSKPSDPESSAKYSTCVHKIVFPEGVLGYVPQEETWVNIGKGEWLDPFWNYNDAPLKIELDIEKSVQNPDKYRVSPFEDYVIIHAEDPSKVYITPYTHTNTQGTAVTITQNCIENDLSGSQYGTLENGKIIIPSNYFVMTWGDGGSQTGDASRSCIITLPDGFDNPLPEDNGVFMGIVAFNDEITNKPISILNESTKEEFNSFVNNLQMGNATLLYYAVDQAINSMQAQSYPENLSNAILVTFTDGLDQGSLAMHPEYRTSRGYASYLAERIAQTSIQGCQLEAYAIGLKSEDVVDDELFIYNLTSLASKLQTEGDNNEHISSVNNITELQQQLTNIYNNLNRQTSQRVVSISVPMMEHGDLYRYTLDGTRENANESQIWFEGTFNIDNLTLENVTYHGFTSTSGTTVQTTPSERVNIKFTLTDCRTLDGELLPVNNDEIDQWKYLASQNKWQHNIENAKEGDVKVEDIKSSVAIMFALDCSTSLGDLFPAVKETANSFINQLAGAVDDSGVEDITVDNTEVLDINDPSVEIFNLQGIRVQNPTRGIYICRKGNTVKKIAIR